MIGRFIPGESVACQDANLDFLESDCNEQSMLTPNHSALKIENDITAYVSGSRGGGCHNFKNLAHLTSLSTSH